MQNPDDLSKGLTPEQLLRWLRSNTLRSLLVESSDVAFSEMMYQVPYWERTGYWAMQQYFDRCPEKPTPVSAFSDFIRVAVSEVLRHQYEALLAVAFDVVPSSEIQAFHAFDQRSGSHAIVIGAQLLIGLPRANWNFLNVLNIHQLAHWSGAYDAQELPDEFFGFPGKLGVGHSNGGGMFLPYTGEVPRAARAVARLASELFSEPKRVAPWGTEAEGIDWLVATAFAQQLFVVLHEYGHASEAWAEGGAPAAHGLLVRAVSGQGDDLEAEDRADLWAATVLLDAVRTSRIRLDKWESDVPAYLKQQQYPLPSDRTGLMAFALFLFFEYLHVAQRLGWYKFEEHYRPPRERYDRITSTFPRSQALLTLQSEMRHYLDSLTTAARFAGLACAPQPARPPSSKTVRSLWNWFRGGRLGK